MGLLLEDPFVVESVWPCVVVPLTWGRAVGELFEQKVGSSVSRVLGVRRRARWVALGGPGVLGEQGGGAEEPHRTGL